MADSPLSTPESTTTDAKPTGQKFSLKKWFDWKNMTSKQKTRVILIGSGVGLVIVIGVAFAVSTGRTPTPISIIPATPTPTPVPSLLPSLLDGMMVKPELATRHPLAIMVENTSVVRPQAGLSQASIVYDAIAEGGITRYMAVFGHSLPDKVGPIRSARTVYIDFAEEFTPGSAYYAHVGGAPDALAKISGDRVYDLNQFSVGAKAFQRFSKAGLATEHTMFGFPEKMYNVAKDLGYKTNSDFRSWMFKDDADIASRAESQSITIPFTSASFTVDYDYNKSENTYKRKIGGVTDKDANNGNQISPKNVVVHYVKYETMDAKGRQKVGVIGEGKATVFRDGKMIEATWKKPSSPGRTIYYDKSTGKEIELNRGQTYVELVKHDSTITVK